MDKVLFALGSFLFVCIFRHREVERTLNLTSGGLGSISDLFAHWGAIGKAFKLLLPWRYYLQRPGMTEA